MTLATEELQCDIYNNFEQKYILVLFINKIIAKYSSDLKMRKLLCGIVYCHQTDMKHISEKSF